MGKHYIGMVGWRPTGSLSASLQKIAHPVGQLGSGPRLMGRIWSGPRLMGRTGPGLVPVFIKCWPRGSGRVRTPLVADRADVVPADRVN